MSEQVKKQEPKLRFPEFKSAGDWIEKKLGEICDYWNGGSNEGAITENGEFFLISLNSIDINGNLKSDMKRVSETDNSLQKNDLVMVLSDVAHGNFLGLTDIIPNNKYVLNQRMAGLRVKNLNACDVVFLRTLINGNQSYFKQKGQGSSQQNLAKSAVTDFPVLLPILEEQQKIADCLSSLDDLITAQTQKIAALKNQKKGLMQQLFPAEGETIPKLRFPEFQDAGEWEEKSLDDCLDYQQPTPYLVADTNYNDAFMTPVLTAGKTFILGYTNEQDGIFSSNLPVIIFDDFTTATQFVDFPFKAKSSAMKILLAKSGSNIKFMYELMQMISYEVGTHERHWISRFAPMLVILPSPDEQKKIADCLSSIDKLITAQSQELEAYNTHKKGLMQQLFPSLDEV